MDHGKWGVAALMLLGTVTASGIPTTAIAQANATPQQKPGRSFTPTAARARLVGDYDGDGRVDLDDYAHWSACVTGPGGAPYQTGCETFDVEGDDDVDVADFAAFQSGLMWCLVDAECADDLFCNGTEVCDSMTGTCDTGVDPCAAEEVCDEIGNRCVPADICGNGLLDPDEECDDGNRIDGDGCDSNCTPTGCGNGIVTNGEQCDDGNGIGGDGCTPDCRRETPGPTNDYCANAKVLRDGTTRFNTANATTDGSAEPGCGFLHDDPQIGSDIWFCYTAACSGELVLSLCGSVYDTKMAVYAGCDCPAQAPLACSDDDCGNSVASRVVVQATPGESYLIRVGGFLGEQGVGQINVRCDVEVCGPGHGDCYQDNGTPGCDDPDCCRTTCALDPYCCDFKWDQYCADEAAGLCTGSFPACGPGAGSCSTGNYTRGCNDVDCCNTVCMQDPFCCVEIWDDTCADEAFGLCFLACGSGGSCFTPNTSPGCSHQTCCEAVCTIDRFCCETLWDQRCVDLADDIDACR